MEISELEEHFTFRHSFELKITFKVYVCGAHL